MHYASENDTGNFLMAAVTYLPRFLPSFSVLPETCPRCEVWLSYVPVAVLASLLAPLY